VIRRRRQFFPLESHCRSYHYWEPHILSTPIRQDSRGFWPVDGRPVDLFGARPHGCSNEVSLLLHSGTDSLIPPILCSGSIPAYHRRGIRRPDRAGDRAPTGGPRTRVSGFRQCMNLMSTRGHRCLRPVPIHGGVRSALSPAVLPRHLATTAAGGSCAGAPLSETSSRARLPRPLTRELRLLFPQRRRRGPGSRIPATATIAGA